MSPIMGLLPGRPTESLRPRLRRDRPDPAGRTSQIHRNPRTTTADGRPLKILTVTDEHTREALATPAARRMGADDTVNVLERIVQGRGRAPDFIRCDNGPEFVAHALKDWCRVSEIKTGYIEPGAPWQNPYAESFNGHLRRELLEMESFNTLYEAQLLIEDWRQEYNHYRPHQSLRYQTPAEYARRWRTEQQPEPS